MIERIRSIIETMTGVDDFQITEVTTSSKELFYIGKNLDMNRAKDVTYYKVKLYKDTKTDGEVLRGEADVTLSPDVTDDEIRSELETTLITASFIKNKHYDLVKGNGPSKIYGSDEKDPLSLVKVMFDEDKYENGGINSAEFFSTKSKVRVVNSRGVDVSFDKKSSNIEIITQWKEGGEETELYSMKTFSSMKEDDFRSDVEDLLMRTKNRAISSRTPSLEGINVILTAEYVKSLIENYVYLSSAQAFYDKISTFEKGKSVQGENITGDKLTITLRPIMEGSVSSQPFDESGVALSDKEIIKDGILSMIHADNKYGQYTGNEVTGNIRNFEVAPGKNSIDELKKQPYLEIHAFSDFRLNDMTKDFGGEIRLAMYFDGEKVIPVSTGSASGNLKLSESDMYFSKETVQINNYIGPKYVLLKNVAIAGE